MIVFQNLMKPLIEGIHEEFYISCTWRIENVQIPAVFWFVIVICRQLDVSFNLLRKIEGLDCLTKIKKLFLLHNKITSIANLDQMTSLQMLELGSNRIRVRPPKPHLPFVLHILLCLLFNISLCGLNFMYANAYVMYILGYWESGLSYYFGEFVPWDE